MKAITTNLVTFAWVAALALVGCGKNDNGGQQIAAVPTYGYVNGSCYNTAINQPVAANLCTGVAGQYYWNGSSCVQQGTNTPVPQNYCTGTGSQYGYPNQYPNYQYGGTNPFPNGQYPIGYFPTGYPSFPGYGGTAGANQQSCVGLYFWMSGGYSRMVTCGGSNCSGYFMYNQSYQPILCL